MVLRYLRSVVTLKYNDARCIGCGRCVEVCPHAVFVMEGKRGESWTATPAWSAALREKLSGDGRLGRFRRRLASALIKGALTGANVNCDCCCGE